jgi:hypothetical protein
LRYATLGHLWVNGQVDYLPTETVGIKVEVKASILRLLAHGAESMTSSYVGAVESGYYATQI